MTTTRVDRNRSCRRLPHISFRFVQTALLAALLIAAAPALAWGPDGHRIVATLAEAQLDDSSRPEVLRLLAISGDGNLADVSNWADDVREDPARRELSRQTARMHYVNFNDARCQFEAESICASGQCVVAAIDKFAGSLRDKSLSDAQRAEALRFLVHFVADAHQPLHAGYRPDKGGNTFQIRIDGKGGNLHSVWDSRIIASREISWQAYAQRLASEMPAIGDGDPRAWAEQSCRITRVGVYPTSRNITPTYLADQLETVDQQLQRASARLAMLLNQSLR